MNGFLYSLCMNSPFTIKSFKRDSSSIKLDKDITIHSDNIIVNHNMDVDKFDILINQNSISNKSLGYSVSVFAKEKTYGILNVSENDNYSTYFKGKFFSDNVNNFAFIKDRKEEFNNEVKDFLYNVCPIEERNTLDLSNTLNLKEEIVEEYADLWASL